MSNNIEKLREIITRACPETTEERDYVSFTDGVEERGKKMIQVVPLELSHVLRAIEKTIHRIAIRADGVIMMIAESGNTWWPVAHNNSDIFLKFDLTKNVLDQSPETIAFLLGVLEDKK